MDDAPDEELFDESADLGEVEVCNEWCDGCNGCDGSAGAECVC